MADAFDIQLKREFIEEASEMLEKVEDDFLEFERHPENDALIDRIFRLTHTIKGSALSCGLNKLGSFAHVLETLLDHLRNKKIDLDTTIVDILLQANDRLRGFIEALRLDFNSVVPTDDLVQNINRIMADNNISLDKGPKKVLPAFGFFDDEPEATPASAPTPAVDSAPEAPFRQESRSVTTLVFEAYVAMVEASAASRPPTTDEIELLQRALVKLRRS